MLQQEMVLRSADSWNKLLRGMFCTECLHGFRVNQSLGPMRRRESRPMKVSQTKSVGMEWAVVGTCLGTSFVLDTVL